MKTISILLFTFLTLNTQAVIFSVVDNFQDLLERKGGFYCKELGSADMIIVEINKDEGLPAVTTQMFKDGKKVDAPESEIVEYKVDRDGDLIILIQHFVGISDVYFSAIKIDPRNFRDAMINVYSISGKLKTATCHF